MEECSPSHPLGNSLLAECILADQDFATDLKFINVDICETVTERVQNRTKALTQFIENKRARKPNKQTKVPQ